MSKTKKKKKIGMTEWKLGFSLGKQKGKFGKGGHKNIEEVHHDQ